MHNFFIGFMLLFLTACIPTVSSGPTELNLNSKEVASIVGFIGIEQERYIRKNLSDIKYLVLNSPGGDMHSAYNIAIMLKYFNIITVIPKNGVCNSACTIIFQAGKQRHASKTSSLMYHSVRLGTKVMEIYFEECSTITNECLQIFEEWKFFVKQETIKMFRVLENYGLEHDVFLLLKPNDPNWLKTGNLIGYSNLYFTAEESMQYNAVTHIIEYNIIE